MMMRVYIFEMKRTNIHVHILVYVRSIAYIMRQLVSIKRKYKALPIRYFLLDMHNFRL